MTDASDAPAAPPTGERAVPYHCPFCAEEDLRPHGPRPGTWHCRACLRVFSVKFLGIEAIPPLGPPPTDPLGG
jgi:transposase-like protein